MPSDYDRIESAITWLTEHAREQPELADLGQVLGLSPCHTQRLFRRWAGVSPKQFLEFLTVDFAKKRLDESRSVLDAAYAAGLSGPGRLHDQMVSVEALTPGEYKSGGEGVQIVYGIRDTPFGTGLAAVTPRGLCQLSFVVKGKTGGLVETLQGQWPKAKLTRDDRLLRGYWEEIFIGPGVRHRRRLPVVLRGTNFQIKVWEALLRIPPGQVSTYQKVAEWIGHPTAARAVGSAVGANPIAYLIPCHRVIRSTGILGEYRWGSARKKAILAWEAAGRSDE